MREGFAIARKHGAMPVQLAAWLEKRLTEPASGWVPEDYRSDGRPGLTVAAAAEIDRLRRDRPQLWARLPASVRRKAAAVGAVLSRMALAGTAEGATVSGDRARTVLMDADRALRAIGGEQHRKAARRAVREGFDLLTDLAPVVGEIKSAIEARDYLRQAEAAEQAGDSDKAAELRVLAGISIASILPWGRAIKAGKFAARIARVSRKLRAEADPVIAGLDRLLPGGIRNRLPGRRSSTVSNNRPDLDRFQDDFAHSPATLDFRAKFDADVDWQTHRARTRGRVERGQEHKGLPIDGNAAGNAPRIGDVTVFERNRKIYSRQIDGTVKEVGRMPKAGKNLKIDNHPHLEKDVIYGKEKYGGRTITIIVRDKGSKGKEVFRETVYYNRYGLPEFEAKGSFWLPPAKLKTSEAKQRLWIQSQLTEMAKDRKLRMELRKLV